MLLLVLVPLGAVPTVQAQILYSDSFGRRCGWSACAEYLSDLRQAQNLTDQWRWEYNRRLPHGSIGYRKPGEFGVAAREERLEAKVNSESILS